MSTSNDKPVDHISEREDKSIEKDCNLADISKGACGADKPGKNINDSPEHKTSETNDKPGKKASNITDNYVGKTHKENALFYGHETLFKQTLQHTTPSENKVRIMKDNCMKAFKANGIYDGLLSESHAPDCIFTEAHPSSTGFFVPVTFHSEVDSRETECSKFLLNAKFLKSPEYKIFYAGSCLTKGMPLFLSVVHTRIVFAKSAH